MKPQKQATKTAHNLDKNSSLIENSTAKINLVEKSVGFSYFLIFAFFFCSYNTRAQHWSDQGNGTNLDRFTINDDNSNHWSQLRLQVSNTDGWNMINEKYLFFGGDIPIMVIMLIKVPRKCD